MLFLTIADFNCIIAFFCEQINSVITGSPAGFSRVNGDRRSGAKT